MFFFEATKAEEQSMQHIYICIVNFTQHALQNAMHTYITKMKGTNY